MLSEIRLVRVPTTPLSNRGVWPAVGEGGRLVGRNREGFRSAFIIAIYGYEEMYRVVVGFLVFRMSKVYTVMARSGYDLIPESLKSNYPIC